jgi:hypothetical protein
MINPDMRYESGEMRRGAFFRKTAVLSCLISHLSSLP